MNMRLSRATLSCLPPSVRRPAYDTASLKTGILHLGVGVFSRAHLAVFTENAIEHTPGDWGIAGVSLRHATVPDALTAQDCLYTVETRDAEITYRVIGAMRQSLFAGRDQARIDAVFNAPQTHVATLSVTEKAYCFGTTGALDLANTEIAHDLLHPDAPTSVVGWLCAGLAKRMKTSGAPITIISCENRVANGSKLAKAMQVFAERSNGALARWMERNVRFPDTMVDCIVPSTSSIARARIEAAIGLEDTACVQRESFAQWVITRDFAGPVPDWTAAGAELVDDVAAYGRLKFHVLNLAHLALTYFGLPRGYHYVREAIADPEIARFVDALIAEEVAPALAPQRIDEYWRKTRARFCNPAVDHQLEKISKDGSLKLGVRLYPLLFANARSGAPFARLAAVVRAWIALAATGTLIDVNAARLKDWAAAGADIEKLLEDPVIFPDGFCIDAKVRDAVIRSKGLSC